MTPADWKRQDDKIKLLLRERKLTMPEHTIEAHYSTCPACLAELQKRTTAHLALIEELEKALKKTRVHEYNTYGWHDITDCFYCDVLDRAHDALLDGRKGKE